MRTKTWGIRGKRAGARGLACAGALAAATLQPAPASAQNMREVPLGGRTALMGGAGIAEGHDSAMPYLNPAGVAGTPYDVFSISASVYAYGNAGIGDYFTPNGIDPVYGVERYDQQYTIEAFTVTPATAAYLVRLNDPDSEVLHVLGLSITTPGDAATEARGSFTARSGGGLFQEDAIRRNRRQEVFAGPTYAVRIGDGVRLGGSLLPYYSSFGADNYLGVVGSENVGGVQVPSTGSSRSTVDGWTIGLTATAGLQLQVADGFWLGVAGELPGIPMLGGGDLLLIEELALFDGGGTTVQRTRVQGNFSRFELARPGRLSLGAAYVVEHSYGFAADVHYYPASSGFLAATLDADVLVLQTGAPAIVGREVVDLRYQSQQTVDVSLGAEIFLSEALALRGGYSSDLSVLELQSNGFENDRRDTHTFVVGLGVVDGDLETTYGIGYRYGLGTTYVDDFLGNASANEPPTVGIEYVSHEVLVLLSGAVRTGEGEKRRALREIEQENEANRRAVQSLPTAGE
jgi:hypothetical protein